MKVKVESRNFRKTVSLKKGTVSELFLKMKLNPESYVATRKKEIILEDERLKEGDEIKLYPVVSGG